MIGASTKRPYERRFDVKAATPVVNQQEQARTDYQVLPVSTADVVRFWVSNALQKRPIRVGWAAGDPVTGGHTVSYLGQVFQDDAGFELTDSQLVGGLLLAGYSPGISSAGKPISKWLFGVSYGGISPQQQTVWDELVLAAT